MIFEEFPHHYFFRTQMREKLPILRAINFRTVTLHEN